MKATPWSQPVRSTTWLPAGLKAVLFDLDGTLIDTAQDIARALNRALTERSLNPLSPSGVRELIGRGAPALISRALARNGVTTTDAERQQLLERFTHHYEALHAAGQSQASSYPGVYAALSTLAAGGYRNAVVTNKHQHLAEHALELAGLRGLVTLVVGGDRCSARKPDPAPLREACAQLGVGIPDVLMVGDSINDVAAARAAGIPVVCVPYGYNEGNDPHTLDCDAMIETLGELPALIGCPPADIARRA
jgi:phosphoglycolate phosphatase